MSKRFQISNDLDDYKEFNGIDASLETSLYEYGLIWKCVDKRAKEYLFIYGVSYDVQGNYNSFDFAHMSKKNFIHLIHESWFDKKGFDSCRGTEEINFPDDVHSAIQYYGNDNIFGSSYNPFEILAKETVND